MRGAAVSEQFPHQVDAHEPRRAGHECFQGACADAIILRAAVTDPGASADGTGPAPRGHMPLSVPGVSP